MEGKEVVVEEEDEKDVGIKAAAKRETWRRRKSGCGVRGRWTRRRRTADYPEVFAVDQVTALFLSLQLLEFSMRIPCIWTV